MAQPLFTNNAATTLASGITNVATTLTVAAGQGALFPSPTGGNYSYITLINAAGTVLEIVKLTARSTDTLTITRGQEGTTASAFSTGDKVELRVTAAGMSDTFANGGVQALAAGTGISLNTTIGTPTITCTITSPIPSGTVMLFYQSAAPTGWTQVTSLNDYDLRLVSGTGGTTGGTTAYSTVFTNQTVSTTTTISGTTGATTLSTAQMPSHNHPSGLYNNICSYNANGPTGYGNSSSPIYTGSTGGGGSHTHSFSGSGSGTSSAVTLNVRYANIIICSKN